MEEKSKYSRGERCGMKHDLEKKREPKGKGKVRVRDRPALHNRIPWRGGPRQEKSFRKGKPAHMLR